MCPEQTEPISAQASALQVPSLHDIEEGMGHDVEWAQGIQWDLP